MLPFIHNQKWMLVLLTRVDKWEPKLRDDIGLSIHRRLNKDKKFLEGLINNMSPSFLAMASSQIDVNPVAEEILTKIHDVIRR